ncbi:MAG: hypothetical protein HYY06_16680 [Deltaproteobacteria bacterium]|nr:hypothetical protein [Deltaproteobacteria bacterium]
MPTVRAFAIATILGLMGSACGEDDGFDVGECRGSNCGGEGEGECVDGEVESTLGYYCCDPDLQTACECPDYWVCTEACGGGGGGGKTCSQEFPDAPGGSQGWAECTEQEGLITCTGDADTYIDDGSDFGWQCETSGEFVVCTRETTDEDYPDEGGGEGWTCYWNEGQRICEYRDQGEWECYELADGSTECRNDNPPSPDGGDWECFFDNGADGSGDDAYLCDGHPDSPDDGADGGFDCFTEQDLYERCRDETPEYPDEGGDQAWDCYTDEFGALICTDGEYEGGGEDVPCPIGGQRWCDGPTYCSWGKQLCQPDFTWGPCLEEDGDRPNNSCACRHFYFDPVCCETQDCVIPADHTEPTVCESDGGLCGYCNNDDDCTDGLCLEDGLGATLCGSYCTADDECPEGFRCAPIRDYFGNVITSNCAPDHQNGCDE